MRSFVGSVYKHKKSTLRLGDARAPQSVASFGRGFNPGMIRESLLSNKSLAEQRKHKRLADQRSTASRLRGQSRSKCPEQLLKSHRYDQGEPLV